MDVYDNMKTVDSSKNDVSKSSVLIADLFLLYI